MAWNTSPLDEPLLRDLAQSAGHSNTAVIPPAAYSAIEVTLPHINAELVTINEEIDRLQRRRSRLIAFQHDLEVARAAHKRLPPEILADIFSKLAEDNHRGIPVAFLRAYAPWLVRSVCSSWRRIAIEHHSLWNKVILEPDYSHRAGKERLISWEKVLSRVLSIIPATGNISVAIFTHKGDNHLADYAFRDVVLPLAPRLHALSLSGGLRAFVELFTMPATASFPNLRKVELDFYPSTFNQRGPLFAQAQAFSTDSDINTEHRTIVQLAPLLRSFTSRWRLFDGSPRQYIPNFQTQVPWANLIDLTIESSAAHIPYDSFFSVLDTARNLHSLVIRLQNVLSRLPQEQPGVLLPRLRHLTIWPLGGFMENCIDHFHLPSLQHLKIGRYQERALRNMGNLISRSGCTLRHFEEGSAHSSISNIFLDFMASLMHLQMLETDRVITPEMLNKIAAGEMLVQCSYQKWRLSTTEVSQSKALSIIAEGLTKASNNAPDKTPSGYRTVHLHIHVGEPKENVESSCHSLRAMHRFIIAFYPWKRVLEHDSGEEE